MINNEPGASTGSSKHWPAAGGMAQTETPSCVRCMHACLNPPHSDTPQQFGGSTGPKLRRSSRKDSPGDGWLYQQAEQITLRLGQHEQSTLKHAANSWEVDAEGHAKASVYRRSTFESGDAAARHNHMCDILMCALVRIVANTRDRALGGS